MKDCLSCPFYGPAGTIYQRNVDDSMNRQQNPYDKKQWCRIRNIPLAGPIPACEWYPDKNR